LAMTELTYRSATTCPSRGASPTRSEARSDPHGRERRAHGVPETKMAPERGERQRHGGQPSSQHRVSAARCEEAR
jgi:hypothetical protein